ncbi:MAG: hypothetical protein KKE05_03540 [Nanoarchaeota archaeon]|nr:hypothetical protein [Nanoarchaeota archaeon]
MKKLILLAIVATFIGCYTPGGWTRFQSTIGTADKPTMMGKWRGQPVTENLLADINGWANWYAKGEPRMPVAYLDAPQWERDLKTPNKPSGGCVDQAVIKKEVLDELGIPNKYVHCSITRNDPYHPAGHRFVIALLNNKWMVMDNGAVQDVVWEFEAVKRSTSGVINYRVDE